MKRIVPAAIAALSLTACALTSTTTGTPTPEPTFDEVYAAAVGAYGDAIFENAGASATPVANMPKSASATYSGYSSIILSKAGPTSALIDILVGRSTLTANFTSTGGTVAGTASDFTYVNDLSQAEFDARTTAASAAYATATTREDMVEVGRLLFDSEGKANGSIDVTNGQITGNTLTADVAGTVEHGGYSTSINGAATGSFAGPTGGIIRIIESDASSFEQGGIGFLGAEFLMDTTRD
ncbi:MAG: hypothetical protein VX874_24945 [Pseudomonadota bacterium]|nr:hypothetical protein [Pseudomonadota bacterium]